MCLFLLTEAQDKYWMGSALKLSVLFLNNHVSWDHYTFLKTNHWWYHLLKLQQMDYNQSKSFDITLLKILKRSDAIFTENQNYTDIKNKTNWSVPNTPVYLNKLISYIILKKCTTKTQNLQYTVQKSLIIFSLHSLLNTNF